jgi:hypothetical protein
VRENSRIDLFSTKTITIKIISIPSIAVLAIIFGLFSMVTETQALKSEKVKEIINQTNQVYIRLFINSKIDSLVSLHGEDICYMSASGRVTNGEME